jgi:hypothetical protein
VRLPNGVVDWPGIRPGDVNEVAAPPAGAWIERTEGKRLQAVILSEVLDRRLQGGAKELGSYNKQLRGSFVVRQ